MAPRHGQQVAVTSRSADERTYLAEVTADLPQPLVDIVEQAVLLHESALESGGGLPGVHWDKLVGACARIFPTFPGTGYRGRLTRGAVLMHGIISAHVFADGNKRTGILLAWWFVDLGGPPIAWTSRRRDRLEQLALDIAGLGLDATETVARFRRIMRP